MKSRLNIWCVTSESKVIEVGPFTWLAHPLEAHCNTIHLHWYKILWVTLGRLHMFQRKKNRQKVEKKALSLVSNLAADWKLSNCWNVCCSLSGLPGDVLQNLQHLYLFFVNFKKIQSCRLFTLYTSKLHTILCREITVCTRKLNIWL
jgi:hypothetical protein